MKEFLEALTRYDGLILVLIGAIITVRAVGYKIMSRIALSAVKWINELEKSTDLTGEEKMDLLISYIKDFIPRIFKVVFNEKVLQSIADSVFEDMQQYSENRVQAKTGLNWQQMIETLKWLETNEASTDNKEEKDKKFEEYMATLDPKKVADVKKFIREYERNISVKEEGK